jgi:hypothetical protein
MLRGQAIPLTAVVQTCLRANAAADRLSLFTMCGLIADYRHLDRVVRDTQAYLACKLEGDLDLAFRPAISDDDLIKAWLGNGRMPVETLWPSQKAINQTRWRFGEQERLRGWGGGIFGFVPGTRAPSFSWVLGTIIVIASAAARCYVEVSFGAEGLCAARARSSLFDVPPIADAIACIRTQDRDDSLIYAEADAALAANALILEGCTPGHRGAGYVLRRFLQKVQIRSAALLAEREIISEASAQAICHEYQRLRQTAATRLPNKGTLR